MKKRVLVTARRVITSTKMDRKAVGSSKKLAVHHTIRCHKAEQHNNNADGSM